MLPESKSETIKRYQKAAEFAIASLEESEYANVKLREKLEEYRRLYLDLLLKNNKGF